MTDTPTTAPPLLLVDKHEAEAKIAALTRALAEERERCAKVAEGLRWTSAANGKNAEVIRKITGDWGLKIAAAIRALPPPDLSSCPRCETLDEECRRTQATIADQYAVIERLEARCETMRKALEPFAKAADMLMFSGAGETDEIELSGEQLLPHLHAARAGLQDQQ
jgi:hypothetical protein